MFAGCDEPSKPGGLAVAVMSNGEIVFKKAFGYANTEHGAVLTTATPFDFASIAKQFTGLAVAMLVADGKVSLDDDIRTYLPEMHDFGAPITLRHLLHHTSGLRDWVALVKLAGRSDDDLIGREFLRRLAFSQRELNFLPGERYLYSNLGYFLLAEIVERATEQPFARWMRTNVFDPLEMHDTFFVERDDAVVMRKAYSYAVAEDGEASALRNGLVSPGSSSLVSTVEDMIRWTSNFETRAVGGNGALELMHTPGFTRSGERIGYGFGISIDDSRGLLSYEHGGSWRGFVCELLRFPEERFAYLFVSNRNPSGCYLRDEVIDMFLGDRFARDEGRLPASFLEATPPKGPRPDVIAGRYVQDLGYTYSVVTISENDAGTFYQRDSGSTLELSPEPGDAAAFSWRGYRVDFGTTQDAGVELTVTPPSGSSRSYRRVPEHTPNVAQLAEYSGTYFSEELHTHYEIVVEGERLLLRHFVNGDVALTPSLPDYLTTKEWWISDVLVDRDQDGKVAGLRVSADGGRVRAVRFVKLPGFALGMTGTPPRANGSASHGPSRAPVS